MRDRRDWHGPSADTMKGSEAYVRASLQVEVQKLRPQLHHLGQLMHSLHASVGALPSQAARHRHAIALKQKGIQEAYEGASLPGCLVQVAKGCENFAQPWSEFGA